MDKVALVFSIVSLLFSAIALFLSYKRTSIASKVEKDRQNDKKKAKLLPIITKEMGSQRLKDVLIIKNEGKSEARDIEIEINGLKLNQFPHIRSDNEVISRIGAGSEFKFLLIIYDQVQFPWDIKITWNDDYKTNVTYETTITM
jgi:hypothetical protein